MIALQPTDAHEWNWQVANFPWVAAQDFSDLLGAQQLLDCNTHCPSSLPADLRARICPGVLLICFPR